MDKFADLPRYIKHKLISEEVSQKIQAIGQKYRFELLRLANITRLIREYYFGEVPFQNFPQEIEKRMGVNLLAAQEITRYIKQEIIDWDPWAEYIARLPKLDVREIVQNHPKIAEMEITSGYVELKDSEDLSDPTIKNWIRDYVSHLGYTRHSQMDRTQYLFHSENGKDLSSPDREKLGIILKSFDENIPLAVDEENNEIVFDGLTEKTVDAFVRPTPAATSLQPPALQMGEQAYKGEGVAKPLPEKNTTQNNFIKPYPAYAKASAGKPAVQPQVQRPVPPMPAPRPIAPAPIRISPQPLPSRRANSTQPVSNPEIDKFFNAPETPDVPPIRIHSMTEHTEPKIAPPAPPRPAPIAPRPAQPQPVARPQHRIINPFSKSMPEPRLDGNIVDLSEK